MYLKKIRFLLYSLLAFKCYAAADDKKTAPGMVFAGGGSALGSALAGTTNKLKNGLFFLGFPWADSISGKHNIVGFHCRTSPSGDADYNALPIGSIAYQITYTATVADGAVIWLKTGASTWTAMQSTAPSTIADPGDAAAIPVTASGTMTIATAAGETRTMAIPTFLGEKIILSMGTDVGDAVVTVASAIDEYGHTTVTFNDVGDFIVLEGVIVTGTTLGWRISGMNGVILGSAAGFGTIIADPGTGAAIPVTYKHLSIALTIGAVETNTLAIPTMVGQTLTLFADVLTSNERTVTVASAINVANNTTMEFDAVSEFIKLEAITLAGTLACQVISNDGVTLA